MAKAEATFLAERTQLMKLVWTPETAAKSYIDTVKSCVNIGDSGAAELISAMAGGYNSRLMVEAWSAGDEFGVSIGLAVARSHTGGRHVCIVPDERSKMKYVEAMQDTGRSPEVLVGDVKPAMEGLVDVDFLVVDCRRNDFGEMSQYAKFGNRGAVVVCKNVRGRSIGGWHGGVGGGGGRRVVYSKLLPAGEGLMEIAHVAMNDGTVNSGKRFGRWIILVDQKSGEEHVFRR
ncbi:hypothetical protein Nepgr_002428 [Nepenthes gracilis]|uniref:DUF1442 family protein n=1 Tax=Nepenthes gracilis TaxID=150966 RepID=A0AAD3RXT0_NEPGR|nr:hypothetical protein Nepgr_002428 [Nepenthes gracilis]